MGILSKILFGINLLLAALLGLSYLSVYISPELFWPLAILGLAFPFLLIGNFIFVLLWVFRFNLKFLLSLAMIIAGWSYVERYIQLNVPFVDKKQTDKAESFKILNFNVRLFNLYQWKKSPNTVEEIFRFVETESPDIICFQDFYSRKTGPYSEHGIISKLHRYKFRYIKYTLEKTKGAGYGMAIFSKFPIIKTGDFAFDKSYNISVFADIKIADDTFRVFNNHLQSIRFLKKDYEFIDSLRYKNDKNQFEGIKSIGNRLRLAYMQRAGQTDKLSAKIQQSLYRVIVCGDFNDTPVSYTYQKMSKNLNDAFIIAGQGTGHTYLGKFPSYRIDYILTDKSLNVISYDCPRLSLSDHYPVVCVVSK